MTTTRMAVVTVVGLGLAAACLALASVVDSPGLAVAGAALIGVVLASREGWLWRGEGRQAVTLVLVVVTIAVAAFVAQLLLG